ncbi:MAG: hypothetical protein GYB55_08560 [Cytophagales bacterium]|uniref:hypothetical protein n=1 Tax=Cyclobacterium marinum TaxID=104 RepID=UPI0030DB9257|nr:hypothetical protein [Cytophagales bacterium]|tara:strand:+ start:3272 stop:3586 length:315 start_codon:yes stop_codon:yes gene_type:complete
MAKKTNVTLPTEAKRNFTLTLEAVSGGLTMFYAFINGIMVIQSDGTKKRTWSGKIPDSQVRIKIRVVGINDASFKLGIDLPGTADDQSLTLKLHGGYYETEIIL